MRTFTAESLDLPEPLVMGVFAIAWRQSAMPAKCAPHETIALNREIRTRIGQRLREHYDLAQRIPFPHALRNWPSSLVNRLSPMEANRKRPPFRPFFKETVRKENEMGRAARPVVLWLCPRLRAIQPASQLSTKQSVDLLIASSGSWGEVAVGLL